MKARDYAISLGLAKPGRGKLSKDAHAAIQLAIDTGQVFEDYKDGRVVKNAPSVTHNSGNSGNHNVQPRDSVDSGRVDEVTQEIVSIKSNPVTHDYSVVYGIELMRLNRPVVIAYEYCAKCLLQVRYCVHDIPQLPEYLGGGNALLSYPTEEDMALAVEAEVNG